MTHIRRVDSNQKEIVKALREMGYSVGHTHIVGDGFPDLVIGRNGMNLLVEVKREGENLTPDEIDFFKTWKGSVIIGFSAKDIHEDFEILYGRISRQCSHE